MKTITLFHTDLPAEIRADPASHRNAAALTKIICERAERAEIDRPFVTERMDDRIVVKALNK